MTKGESSSAREKHRGIESIFCLPKIPMVKQAQTIVQCKKEKGRKKEQSKEERKVERMKGRKGNKE